MSKWEPRAGVSRRGNPYAGVGPWHVSGPKKPRKASKASAGGGEMSDGAAVFLAIVLVVVLGGGALLLGLGMIVALFQWNPLVGVVAAVLALAGLVGQRNSVSAERAKRPSGVIRSWKLSTGQTCVLGATMVVLIGVDGKRTEYPLGDVSPSELVSWPDVQRFLRERVSSPGTTRVSETWR